MTVVQDQQLATYEEDFCAWLEQQGALMRAGRFGLLDVENIAEELDALGRSEPMQPWRRSDSWLNSIHDAREASARLIADSPGLRARLPLAVRSEFSGAGKQASREIRIPGKDFPAKSPWSMDQLLNGDVLPENRQ